MLPQLARAFSISSRTTAGRPELGRRLRFDARFCCCLAIFSASIWASSFAKRGSTANLKIISHSLQFLSIFSAY